MSEDAVVIKAKPQRKVFKPTRVTKIPESISKDPKLQAAAEALPKNYNFEIPKTIWRIRETNAKLVALQMPEGLLMFATTISDIIREFTSAETVIMGDVTYGACCIDDYTAKIIGVDLLIHYGHSCLVPVEQTTGIKVLYIFVDIQIDPKHLIDTVIKNFPDKPKTALVSTIQFVTTLQFVSKALINEGFEVTLPQTKPLSAGEILGCTAPVINCADIIIYVGDGRFHLEAAMIANPNLKAYKYDPYTKKFTTEIYDKQTMEKQRLHDITLAKQAKVFGIIMGTLGRQGNPNVVEHLRKRLEDSGKEVVVILMSEIFPAKLELFKKVDAFVQVACPRLSIDWGSQFKKPCITSYELSVVLGDSKWHDDKGSYPMDFYANASLGPWTPNYKPMEKDPLCCGKCGNSCSK